jgi:hypothetical protein
VHAWHWLALWRALGRRDGVVVVRPFTSAWTRRAVLRRARRHHPAAHLVVVAATPAQARAGQRARGRSVGARAMRRHERHWAAAELDGEGWTSVLVAARSQPAPGPRSPSARACAPSAPGRQGVCQIGKATWHLAPGPLTWLAWTRRMTRSWSAAGPPA